MYLTKLVTDQFFNWWKYIQPTNFSSLRKFLYLTIFYSFILRKIPEFNLISWRENFMKRHNFRRVSGKSTETVRKLYLSTKCPHQEIRWNYGILHSVRTLKNKNQAAAILHCPYQIFALIKSHSPLAIDKSNPKYINDKSDTIDSESILHHKKFSVYHKLFNDI